MIPKTETERFCAARIGETLIGKWHLDAMIGVGGMAAVYAATHRNGNRKAIKVLHPELASREELRARFLREAYIANRIEHPGCVAVLDDDLTDDGSLFLVMDLLHGQSLRQVADAAGGTLERTRVIDIADRVLDILAAAHRIDVVHRDVKPENVFITDVGEVKLLDYGIARYRDAVSDPLTRVGMLLGTPGYMAPELVHGRGEEVDARTDLWSVGAMMLNLLTGTGVHEGDDGLAVLFAAATRPALSLAECDPSLPSALVRVVDRALAYDRAQRYADAASFRADLHALAGRSTPPPVDPAVLVRPRPQPQPQPPVSDAALDTLPDGTPPIGAVPIDLSPIVEAPDPDRESRDHAMTKIDGLEVVGLTPRDIDGVEAAWAQLKGVLQARILYGDDHPESRRRFDDAFGAVERALAESEAGLLWNVTPYSFQIGDRTVWEVEDQFLDVPYRIFAAGVRVLGILPGLLRAELAALLDLIARDVTGVAAAEDDLVTLLWEAGLPHVIYREVDTFAEGGRDARLEFERHRDDVISEARAVDFEALQSAWQVGKGRAPDAHGRQAALLDALTGRGAEAAAQARAANLRVVMQADGCGATLALDESTRRVVEAQLALGGEHRGDRFVSVAADAWLAVDNEARQVVTAPLALTVEGLAATNPELAVAFVSRLGDIISRRAPTAGLANALVPPEVAARIAIAAGARDVAIDGLLTHLDAGYLPGLLELLPRLGCGITLGDALDFAVEHAGAAHVETCRAHLVGGSAALGLGIIDALVRIDSPESRAAVAYATQSDHPEVRVAALGHFDGLPPERLRAELMRLLSDGDASVRTATLEALAAHDVRASGPVLVVWIRSPAFDTLPLDERRLAIGVVEALAPQRAEALACELLSRRRVFARVRLEGSRRIAAEALGRVGHSPKSIALLREVTQHRIGNSRDVRDAAELALELIRTRHEDTA